MTDVSKLQLVKYAPPPPELPIYGKEDPVGVSFFGRTNYAAALEEKRFVFGIKRGDRRQHLYIIGKSGVGKSKLLELLLRQDLAYRYGVCLVDSHGETFRDILDSIPEHRIEDVCLIDAADSGNSVVFNPFVDVPLPFRHHIAQGFIEIMRHQFSVSWSPRLEHLLRFSCLALLECPRATMRDILALLTDGAFRERAIDFISDAMVRRFWKQEFPIWAEKFETEAITPLVNRLSQFFSVPFLASVFGNPENRINFETLISERKIILVNLANGQLGAENAGLLSSLLVMKLKQAGMARAALPAQNRPDFYIYFDGFPTLTAQTFEGLLSEASKYGLCLTFTHRYLHQLSATVRSAILGTVGSVIVFRVAGDDALELETEMTPVFKAKDMVNLGVSQFYIKMVIDGETYDPFSAEALKVLPPPHRSYRGEIVDASRQKYGPRPPLPQSS